MFDRLPKLVLEQAVYIVLILYAAHIDPRQKQAAYTKITDGMECSLLITIIYDSYNNKESNHVVLNNYCSHSYPLGHVQFNLSMLIHKCQRNSY